CARGYYGTEYYTLDWYFDVW
nr:immunoglobulin heavy chain junction region [Macaca mulatta]MOY30594.1 immunoglobulin heavy chain junction region [Macaca mulatta]